MVLHHRTGIVSIVVLLLYCLALGHSASLPTRSQDSIPEIPKNAFGSCSDSPNCGRPPTPHHPRSALVRREGDCEDDEADTDPSPNDAPYRSKNEEPEQPENDEDYKENDPNAAEGAVDTAVAAYYLRKVKDAVSSEHNILERSW